MACVALLELADGAVVLDDNASVRVGIAGASAGVGGIALSAAATIASWVALRALGSKWIELRLNGAERLFQHVLLACNTYRKCSN